MNNGLELVLGGARSGKSGYALEISKNYGDAVTWIATAEAYDDEMTDRINKHKAERPLSWKTVESPLKLSSALLKSAEENRCVVVDCLTLWLSNWVCKGEEQAFLKEREFLWRR
jgi:adenosylcobinamide kinase/adenosylcobinamide-phosphate guanylyltransferase